MTEKLLQFIWQHQYFNTTGLQTEDGENLQILKYGEINHNQGADFLNAIIKINNVKLAGNIELHIKTSDWEKHHHSSDKNYSGIILHVVWENDKSISVKHLPMLVLQEHVPKVLLKKYEQLMNNVQDIACSKFLPALNELSWLNWKERLAMERLQQKSERILQLLKESNNHWEEVFWKTIAYNFGVKVNAEFFQQLANSISINILAKHKSQIYQLEALLLGQANLLNLPAGQAGEKFNEPYPKMLQKEYLFLSKKYHLVKLNTAPHFLRMRPANFPTVRLAQLAMLIHQSSHLFSIIKETTDVKEIKLLFNVTANDYWNTHYVFDEESEFKIKNVGSSMMNNIIINTVVPVLFAYGLYINDKTCTQRALQWLGEIKAEENSVIKKFTPHKITCTNALDSQALVQLYKSYCVSKNCLKCAVGNRVLSSRF